MIPFSIALVPLSETFAIGRFGLVKYLCRHSSTYNFGRGWSVCGHFHVSYLLSATLPISFAQLFGMTFARFTKGAHLCGHGKLCRGFVQLFLFTPFHGGKVAQNQEKSKP